MHCIFCNIFYWCFTSEIMVKKKKSCNCHYQVIDGIHVHINADGPISKDTQEAINKMVKLAYNYVKMKDLLKP